MKFCYTNPNKESIQGGMPYAHTHISGLNMLKVFAKKTGIAYRGGFLLGLGALLDGASLDKLPNKKKVKPRLASFFAYINIWRGIPGFLV